MKRQMSCTHAFAGRNIRSLLVQGPSFRGVIHPILVRESRRYVWQIERGNNTIDIEAHKEKGSDKGLEGNYYRVQC